MPAACTGLSAASSAGDTDICSVHAIAAAVAMLAARAAAPVTVATSASHCKVSDAPSPLAPGLAAAAYTAPPPSPAAAPTAAVLPCGTAVTAACSPSPIKSVADASTQYSGLVITLVRN